MPDAAPHPMPATDARATSARPSPLPPGPRFAPVTTYRYVTRPAEYLSELRARFGDVVLMPTLNGRVVMVMTPELAKAVFGASPDHYDPFGMDAIAPLLGPGSLFTSTGDAHRRGRRLLTPPFHRGRMAAYTDTMRDVVLGALSRLHEGDEIRVLDVTTAISMEIILRTVFGLGEHEVVARGGQVLTGLLESLGPSLLFTRRLHTPVFPAYRRYRRADARYRAFIADVLAERRRRGGAGDDVLSLLLAARDENGVGFTDAEIESHLLTLLIAGHETTSIVLAWALHELARRPEALGALRGEIATLGPDAGDGAVAELPYVDAVVKETQRRRTVVTDVIRLVRHPLDIGGYRVPAGFGVSVGLVAIHHDPELFPDPYVFRPERFLGERAPAEPMPFGGGHRRCIGAAFSDHESRIALGVLAARLDLELLGPAETPVRRNVTMGPRHGVRARVLAVR